MAAWVRCIVTVVVQQSYHINKTETVCTLLTSILNVPLVPGVHRSRHTLLLSEHSSDVECISDELYIITRQPSCGLYPTTQPKCLASISLAPCDRTQRHSSYPSFKGVFKNVSVFSGPVQCDPFGLTSAPSFTIAQQQPTFPPKRFDIFFPLTGGYSEGIGAVLVFIFVFAAFDPT